MPEYPFNSNLHDMAGDIAPGNFGLWYNKFIPVDNFSDCNASDLRGNKDAKHTYYKSQYDRFKKEALPRQILEQRHCAQIHFCTCMETRGYRKLVFSAALNKALVTGLGESHPSETSLVFDHTSGVPYIPASGIKGIVRFSHSLNLLFDDNGHFTEKFVTQGRNSENKLVDVLKESDNDTWIPQLFGGGSLDENGKIIKKRGKVIFLDAYPETIPDLHVDIINPHYHKYHGGEDVAPGDYCDPVPVKFLTVAQTAVFIFRVLIPEDISMGTKKLTTAFLNALETHGVGAKTAIGYGQFSISSEKEPRRLQDRFDEYLDQRSTPEEKLKRKIRDFVSEINKSEKNSNEVNRKFDLWQQDKEINKDKSIARALLPKVNKKKSDKSLTKHYTILSSILELDLDKKNEESVKYCKARSEISDDEFGKIEDQLKKVIAKGFISKKDKNKLITRYKKDFSDYCSKIKKLPKKAK